MTVLPNRSDHDWEVWALCNGIDDPRSAEVNSEIMSEIHYVAALLRDKEQELIKATDRYMFVLEPAVNSLPF